MSGTLSHLSDPGELSWEFVQSFGDDSSSYDYDDADDLVTAVEFSPTGEYLAIGDKAGRVSIVQEAKHAPKAGQPAAAARVQVLHRVPVA